MEKYARDVPEERCFSIVFKDRKNNLDLIASSEADASHWVAGLKKIIVKSNSMSQRQKLQQYPFGFHSGKITASGQESVCLFPHFLRFGFRPTFSSWK